MAAAVEGTLLAQDGAGVSLSGGCLVGSGDSRADFRVVNDQDTGIITMAGRPERVMFAVIDGPITERACYLGLRSSGHDNFGLTPESVGGWKCVQTSDGRIAAIRIDRIDMDEGSFDLTYLVWVAP